MDDEKLKKLYLEYLEARDRYLSRRWHKVRSFALRIASRSGEFARLLGSEGEFRENAFAWIERHVQNNGFSREDMEQALLSLELYKSELSGRSAFLVVISIVLAANIAFFNQISALIGESGDFWMILFGFVTVLLIVFERSSVARHAYVTEQLVTLIKSWLNKNGG